jgi:hypothetical protein
VLYVYAFVAAPASVPPGPGLGGAPLGSQRAGGLEAVVSEHDAPVEVSEAAVVDHARVVEAVAAANAGVLPVRFGGMHADEAALREAMAGRTELGEALDRVRGCVELGLRVMGEGTAPADASSGGAYMRARLEQRHELERLADELHAPLAAVARESTVSTGTTPRLLLSAAYLVPREHVDGFRTTLASLQSRHPELGIVCTGPWPPYSFVLVREAGS